MNHTVTSVKEKIQQWMEDRDVILILAATTGYGIRPYLHLAQERRIKFVVVVAHKIGNPRWRPFDRDIQDDVHRQGGIVLYEKAFWAVRRVAPMLIARYLVPFFGYKEKNWEELLAVGGRVCLQITEIAMKKNEVHEGDIVVAVAGEHAALALKINRVKPPHLALLDIIFRSDIQLD